MADDNTESQWPAEHIAAVNEAVRGHTVESLEVHEAGTGHQHILITFADGLQLRIVCQDLGAVEPIEPQHI